MSILDDLKMIHERDAQDALGVAGKQLDQYLYNFNFSWSPDKEIKNVVVAGMGGSGLGAKAYKSFGGLNVSFEIVQDYNLPSYVNENTLLICSSYSGNTEETLSVFDQALNSSSKPMIIVVSSGGKLMEYANQNQLPFLQLPGGYQPRYTFGFQYRALVEIFNQSSLAQGQIEELGSSVEAVRSKLMLWAPDVITEKNSAKQLALELVGSSAVIYSSSVFYPLAYKWKISINENAKNVAWCNQLPEFNHNEFLGWTSHPIEKPYKIVNLVSDLDHPQVQRRFEVSEKLLSGKKPSAEVVKLEGGSALEQLIFGAAFGDFVSLYLALLNGLNPTPVDIIEKLKVELAN